MYHLKTGALRSKKREREDAMEKNGFFGVACVVSEEGGGVQAEEKDVAGEAAPYETDMGRRKALKEQRVKSEGDTCSQFSKK